MTRTNNPKRVYELFNEFKQNSNKHEFYSKKLNLRNVNNLDVYNITAPFLSAGKTVIAGRVEPRDQEHSKVIFFEEIEQQWFPITGAPIFELQDPFVVFIKNKLIFGGVKISEIINQQGKLELQWQTVFYRGNDIFDLTEFSSGPVGMKDIRLCQLAGNKIGLFTRPQGAIGGRGTIGYTELNELSELTIEKINSARLLKGMFHPLDWGGVNEAKLMENGKIGVLAHVACFEGDLDNNERHYYAASFIFDPGQSQFHDLKVIASRDLFSQGAAKRPDLRDVIFSSGLIQIDHQTRLYAGVSDAEAHWIEIDDPFESCSII